TNSGIAVKKSSTQNLSAPESWDNINLNLQIPADKIYKIIEYQNHLFAATNKGLIEQTDNVWQTILINGSDVFDLLVRHENLYLLTSHSIYKYNNILDEVIFVTNIRSIILNQFELNNETFYIASNKGLIKTDLHNNEFLFPNGPGSNAIINIDVDSQGNLWSASGKDGKGKGVFKYDGEFWETLSTEKVPEFKTNDFHKVSASNNSVYFSNWGRGFVRLKDDTIEQFDADNTEINGITDHP
ncbi:MAG: hypothetical protein GY936_08230, partial [Ignavibacteriae bacterium]|nr:hypothetical protein [Ignavibacteriota bacterium]